MSARIRIENYLDRNIKERTRFGANAAVAATNLNFESTDGIAVDDFLMLGALGAEGTERRKVATVTDQDDVVVTPALSYAHKAGEEITELYGDQVRIYRAANADGSQPADGSFSAIATIDLDPDQLYTDYEDSTGGTGYWYKYTYYNSETETETPIGEGRAFRGGGYQQYATLYEIRREAGFRDNQNVTDALIDEKRLAAQDEINGALGATYTVPFASAPPLIQELTRQLAAGMLLQTEYGPTSDGTTKEGAMKLKQAREMLAKIQNRQIVLNGADGDPLIVQSGVTGWPDETTADASEEEAGGGRMFTRKQVF